MGTVTEEAAAQSGLTVGTPVVAGGLDAACGTLGRCDPSGETQEQGGQVGGMSICTDTYKADPSLILRISRSARASGFFREVLPEAAVSCAGLREFADYEGCRKADRVSSLEQLNEIAAEKAVPPGSEGVVFLPYMSGERSPIWNPYAKGVFYGLDFAKPKGTYGKMPVWKGVAFSLRHNQGGKAAGC